MSAEPPSSGRPTGPPSGPLSGPSEGPTRQSSGPPSSQPPSSGPPSQPPSGPPPPPSSGGAHRDPSEPGRPWWRSVPRVATIAAVVAAAVIVALVFSRPDGGSEAGGEIFLQAAGKSGPDPFTESTAKDDSAPPVTPSPTTQSPSANAVRGVDGGAPGLYGGTRNVASCDVEKQIKALAADPAKNRAFASVARVAPSGVPAHLRSLTPVQLRMDTRVTNHGYRDGAATSYQAVLQAGTAVLIDDRGEPRVRCACGNPLTAPVAQQGTPRRTGDSWPSYDPAGVVAVSPAKQPVKSFVVYDPEEGTWFTRAKGDTGGKDRETEPPADRPTPSASVTTPSTPAEPDEESSPRENGTTPEPEPESPDPPTSEEPSPEDSPPASEPAPGTPPQSAPGSGEQQPDSSPAM
ncbi:DUF6777 domain-containing protein [Streptomyces sp. DH24]|uniref:DUF6777 domain-containing protein n=1 Tax=Streptomyces sp. DH24 TaxID=3040123 RepID=UPI002441E147|nr:DUF6777 domain-containing protein [Streptomyces sp. DH24]MDG9717971.1 hypothetical protein [Streptomyces sp. DH24]